MLLSTMVNGGMEGSLVEIGVFRGKSFIHMSRHLKAGQVFTPLLRSMRSLCKRAIWMGQV